MTADDLSHLAAADRAYEAALEAIVRLVGLQGDHIAPARLAAYRAYERARDARAKLLGPGVVADLIEQMSAQLDVDQ